MGTASADRSPLDRGYAWVITLAVFGSNMLMVGYFRSWSVFFVDMVDTFNTTFTTASIIMGVQSAVCCLTALVVYNVLLDVLEIRTVAVFGGLVFSAGITLSHFAPSAPVLMFTLGVLVGVGNGCAYGPGTVLLGQYFHKRRALATSLACMGGSVGSMLLPALATELLIHYGLRGAFLLYGGLTLNLCVTTCLYRPLPAAAWAPAEEEEDDSAAPTVPGPRQPSQLVDSSSASDECQSSLLGDSPPCSSDCQSSRPSDGSGVAVSMTPDSKTKRRASEVSKGATDSLVPEIPEIKVEDSTLQISDEALLTRRLDCDVSLRNGGDFRCSSVSVLLNTKSEASNVTDCSSETRSRLLPVPQMCGSKPFSSALDLFPAVTDWKHHGHNLRSSLVDVSFRSGDFRERNLSDILKCVNKAAMYSSQPQLSLVSAIVREVGRKDITVILPESNDVLCVSGHISTDDAIAVTSKRGLCHKLREQFHCNATLLRQPSFWLVQMYVSVAYIGSQGAYVYLPALLQEKGLSKGDTMLALTLWGACSLLGRFLCGMAADRRLVRPATMVAAVYFFLAALFFLVSWLPHTLTAWLAFTLVYGLLEGIFFCLLPIIIIDFVSLHHFPSTFGFSHLTQCASSMFLFPVLGQLRDQSGDYHATYYLIGACALAASSLFIFVSVAQALKRNH